jgi:hypothetical protein
MTVRADCNCIGFLSNGFVSEEKSDKLDSSA